MSATPNWQQRKHWVLGMDGTLTVAVHDFTHMRNALGAPEGVDLISFINSLPKAEAQRRLESLKDYEEHLARNAQIGHGVAALLNALKARGATLGVLTRNRQDLAYLTLETIGISHFFAKEDVLGRDEAPPKPSPDGLKLLADTWRVKTSEIVMVGDYHYDIDCARAAGATGVLLYQGQNPWPGRCDIHLPDAHALLNALT